jgi:hypothetical protein
MSGKRSILFLCCPTGLYGLYPSCLPDNDRRKVYIILGWVWARVQWLGAELDVYCPPMGYDTQPSAESVIGNVCLSVYLFVCLSVCLCEQVKYEVLL